ncbi:MAG: hypothetical protein VST68_01015 [Nitrospirota bacterium]|nr:hypothetical protein [Nitrospirota bacterium]
MLSRQPSEPREHNRTRRSFARPCIVIIILAGLGCLLNGPGLAQPLGPILVGQVKFNGVVPSPFEITVTNEDEMEFCGEKLFIQPLTVNSVTHGVEGAVVSVKTPKEEGVQGKSLSVPHRMVANVQCQFNPRVVVAQRGDMLEVQNLDPILHQTHLTQGERTRMNIAQLPQGKSVWKKLEKAGVYHFRCDKHKFMDAYLLVFDHPFFSKTNTNGIFRMVGLTPGNQTIQVWHETLGILEKEITLPDHGIVNIDLVYP